MTLVDICESRSKAAQLALAIQQQQKQIHHFPSDKQVGIACDVITFECGFFLNFDLAMYRIVCRTSTLLTRNSSRIFCQSRHRNCQVAAVRRTFHSNPLQLHPNRMSGTSTPGQPKHANRLAQEKSPYLLQHAHNPVEWYPWGDEAIERARRENKLIFLSVGYSTCHWCHVMEHESFENEEVAAIMNENFVNVKVDREERPDIDKIYMNFVVMINGSGGWPMSVWITPDLAPITAGTYFPPTDRWGMPGFKTVLNTVAGKWRDNQIELKETGRQIIQAIRKELTEKAATAGLPNPDESLNQAIRIYKRNFDRDYGGFGSHPKFPEVAKLNFLLHAYVAKRDKETLELVLRTLQKIGNGGIHDHIFGGFARYSVDRKWHVPHFEKMLYDQGQLMGVYAHAYQITNDQFYLNVADKIFNYMMKDLKHPAGGFYSGEDADSLPPGSENAVKVEGAFYAWTYAEIRNLIKENAERFDIDAERVFEIYSYHYDIQEAGNVEPASDPHGHLTAKNILIVRKSFENTCDRFDLRPEQLTMILQVVNCILHEARDQRPRPHLDTKIITAWNGLVLSGLSKLANCCSNRREEYRKTAAELIDFVRNKLYNKDTKKLLRSCYGQGTDSNAAELLQEPIDGFLDDYAFFIRGLLDYYKCSLDLAALEWAKELQDTQDALFWDDEHGGYFYSEENSPNVVVRLKEDHDGAEPCGNSMTARNLVLLAAYYDEIAYRDRAQKLFEYFSDVNPLGYILPEMMSALLLFDRGIVMMAIVGSDTDTTQQFICLGQKYFIPGLIIAHLNRDDPSKNIPNKSSQKFHTIKGLPTVYVCRNKACQLPITEPSKLDEHLKENYLMAD